MNRLSALLVALCAAAILFSSPFLLAAFRSMALPISPALALPLMPPPLA